MDCRAKPGNNGVLLGQANRKCCRRRGWEQERRGLRAHTPQLGVANWNLSGLMSSSCSQEQHTPELGAWAPPFSPATACSSRRPRETTRRSSSGARDDGIGILALVTLFGTTKSARAEAKAHFLPSRSSSVQPRRRRWLRRANVWRKITSPWTRSDRPMKRKEGALIRTLSK